MIALFDSGFGGLTVLKPILEHLPQYDYLYLGDNGRAPYGNHSGETIRRFSEEAVEYLFSKGARLIIFACNTASSVALRHVQQKYLQADKENERKILGVLIPVAEEAVRLTKNGRIALMATRATVESGVYEAEIHKMNPKAKISTQACPLLVPLIEENWHHQPEATSILKKYLKPLSDHDPDVLILGSTHYPLMYKQIRASFSKKAKLLPSGEITALKLAEYLQRHPEIESKLSKNRKRHFVTTDDPKKFRDFTLEHFGLKIKLPEKIRL